MVSILLLLPLLTLHQNQRYCSTFCRFGNGWTLVDPHPIAASYAIGSSVIGRLAASTSRTSGLAMSTINVLRVDTRPMKLAASVYRYGSQVSSFLSPRIGLPLLFRSLEVNNNHKPSSIVNHDSILDQSWSISRHSLAHI